MWEFISDPANQKTIAWIGGGAVTCIAGLWTAYLKLSAKQKPQPAKAKPTVAARDGIVGGGDVTVTGNVEINKSPDLKLPLVLGALGIAALGYAAFFAPNGDCIRDSVTSGGDINAGQIVINGGSGDVEC